MEMLVQDVRFALRMLSRNRGFAAAALLTLALGIGATTAVFSLVYGVLLRPLPYHDPGSLVRLSEAHAGATSPLRAPLLSNLTYYAWSPSPRTIEAIAAYGSDRYTVTGLIEPMRVRGAAVSPALFSVLRVSPALGRFFSESEAVEEPSVVVLSDGFWRQYFGGDPQAIGRTLVVDERAHTIVGIAPPDFYFPDHDTRLWVPRNIQRPEVEGGVAVSVFSALSRLRPGFTAAQAAAEGTAAARGAGARPMVAEMLFGTGGRVEVRARSLAEETTAPVRPALLVLAGGVCLLLTIACANVASLFVSRGLARQRELAVRAAIGAGQGRLIRQLVTESLVVSLLGGVLGLVLALALLALLPSMAPRNFPRLDDVHVDIGLFIFAASISIATGLLSGLAPVVRGINVRLQPSLHAESRYSEDGLRGSWTSRFRGVLLVVEAALAVMLLVSASLLIRSFGRLVAVDPGYDASNVVTGGVYLPSTATSEQGRQFAKAFLDRARRIPSVLAAGAGNMAPLSGATAVTGFRLPAEGNEAPRIVKAVSYVVTPGYAEALSLRVLEGRLFTPGDETSAIQAVVVNREFVRQYLSPGAVAGRRIRGFATGPDTTTEIIGVVGNVLKDGLDGSPQPEMYLLPRGERSLGSSFNVVIRTSRSAAAMIPLVRSLVAETDRSAAIDEVGTLGQRLSASVSQPRFATAVLSAFAGLALLLATVGLYGVLTYNVTQRRRELGVRSALGATRTHLVTLVLRQSLMFVAAGIVLGLAAAAAFTRLMSALLFGISPGDAVSFGAAPVMLLLVALAACLIPARRSASTDPAEALRCE